MILKRHSVNTSDMDVGYLDKSAKFSECGKYRYYLLRVWEYEKPFAMCIGLNPSTADDSFDDTTIRNLCYLLKDYGYGGLYMTNLFAFISPEPDDLRSCPDPVKDNDKWLTEIAGHCAEVIFCWGAFKQAEYRARKVIGLFPDAYCLGKTSSGKPMHPLAATIWQKAKCKIQPFKK
jgi:hypothetical protein